MALPDFGVPLSLNDIHIEAGGATGTLCSINDADIRALIGKTASTQMGFDEWYGASAVILLTESVYDAGATEGGSFGDLGSNPYHASSQWAIFGDPQPALNSDYENIGAINNRWEQATGNITITNIFNITGVDSSVTGKTIYFEEVRIERFRVTNGSDGTNTVTSRWYQSDLSTSAQSSSVAANSTTDNTYFPTTFGGTISSANNGSASLKIVNAVGLTTSSGTATGNSAKGMTNRMFWRANRNDSTQNIRIE